jgi:hypothetical protein
VGTGSVSETLVSISEVYGKSFPIFYLTFHSHFPSSIGKLPSHIAQGWYPKFPQFTSYAISVWYWHMKTWILKYLSNMEPIILLPMGTLHQLKLN